MREQKDIEDRVRFLLNQELDTRVQHASERLPTRCTHNHRQPLDERRLVEGAPNDNFNRITPGRSLPVVPTIGLCMLGSSDPEEWLGTICEDPIDAKRCPYFNPKSDKKALWAEFSEQVQDAEWLRVNMPEVYALLWAIERPSTPKLPWWKRLLFYFAQIRVEPLLITEDPTKLLPPPT